MNEQAKEELIDTINKVADKYNLENEIVVNILLGYLAALTTAMLNHYKTHSRSYSPVFRHFILGEEGDPPIEVTNINQVRRREE